VGAVAAKNRLKQRFEAKAVDRGRVPHVVEKGEGVFSRYPKNNWLMG
jgi:hypothetical protein